MHGGMSIGGEAKAGKAREGPDCSLKWFQNLYTSKPMYSRLTLDILTKCFRIIFP